MEVLETLVVAGQLSKRETLFKPLAADRKLKHSRSLYLHNMTFEEESGDLGAWVDLSCLKKLTIQDCDGVENFITEVGVSYVDQDQRHALKVLKIHQDESQTTSWSTGLVSYYNCWRG
jgi:hypothetical protein